MEGTEEFASNLGFIRDQASEVIWYQQGLLNQMMLWGDQKLGNFHFSYDSGKWVAGIHCKFIYESVPQNWEYCFSHRSEERGERCLCDFPVPSAGISNQREHSRPEFVLGVLNNWSHWKTPSRWVRTPAEDQGGCSKELVQDFTSSWPSHSRPYLALILSSQ